MPILYDRVTDYAVHNAATSAKRLPLIPAPSRQKVTL
jgi:hypothetical protein